MANIKQTCIKTNISSYSYVFGTHMLLSLYSEGTTDGQMLHKAQQTLTILSKDVSSPGVVVWQREMGIVLCKIVYLFLTRPMTRST